jgi:ligand-binding sensor domain-containing protein
MRWVRLLLIFGQIFSLAGRSLPIRHIESNIIPLGITQDREGLLWLATSEGIVRFDGLHYEVVRAAGGGIDIAVTPDGSVWLATGDGLVRYDRGSFTKELAGQGITALTVTPAGRLLAATENDLYLAVEPNKKPVRWSRVAGISVHARFLPDLEGNTWFGCGLYTCSWSDADVQAVAAGEDWSSHRLPSPINRADSNQSQVSWTSIVATPDHRIWGRNGPEIFVFANGRTVSHTVPVDTFQGVRPGFFLDRRGRLWIPGRQLHVVENGALEIFRPSGAPLQDVTAVFEDRRGTLWFGLAGKGLAALPDESTLQSWAEPEGIAGSVLDLAAHPRLGLMAATNAGAYVLDAAQQRWRALPAPGNRTALRSAAADAAGAILTLPYSGGLFRSAAPFLSARELPLPGALNRKRMRHLVLDPHGALWIASIDGLYRIGPAENILRVPLPQGAAYASDMSAGPDGRLWVGYQGGVARCADDNCTQAIALGDGLLDPKIRTIAPGSGEVWVGYRPSIGFSRFQQKPGGWQVTHFNPQDGYGPSDTHFLRRDRRGWIWRGSTDGVYVCDGKHTQPEDWLHLTFGDGVNASYANMYGFLEQADGGIWIGTQKGVVRLHPGDDWFQPAPPRVSSIPQSMRVRQDLEIHLSQPGLPPFQSRLFRYRLWPIDDRWRFSSDGTVRYSRLRAGAYRFEVAPGHGGAATAYGFTVEGQPWMPAPVWILLALAVAVGLTGVLLRRRHSLQKIRTADIYWQEKRRFLEERAAAETTGAPAEDWSGRLLDDRFLLETRLAAGGFAAVYRATDRANHDEPVAVKLLHPLCDNEEWRRHRFLEEVRALQKLHDAGVVEIRHAGEAAPDRPYLVMELIEGITLRALLREGRMEFGRAARLLRQMGSALAASHRANILHRDLKPENVMICAAGLPSEHIKLIDFGIASIVEEQSREHTTKLAGSPGYLAPERWVGLASCKSDIYSMAAIAAEMLAGVTVAELGFCAGDPQSFRRRLEALRPEIPQIVIGLLVAALDYDPAARPGNAELFATALSNNLRLGTPGTPGRTPVSNHQ